MPSKKEKKVKAWAVINKKGEPIGCVPFMASEKVQRKMIEKTTGLYATFEKKQWANYYGKLGDYKVVPCIITYKI